MLATAPAGHAGTGFATLTGAGSGAKGDGVAVVATGGADFGSGLIFGAMGRFAAGATGAAGAALAGSPFLTSPRATRKVPFDCSMLMGLVRTRFAPIRNALATPA